MAKRSESVQTAGLTIAISDSISGFPRRDEEGSALVEFALVCLFFLTMLFGIIDFGRALYAYHFVSNAARDATRWAAVNGANCTSDNTCTAAATGTDVQNYVKNSITPTSIDSTKLTTTAVCGVSGGSKCADSVPFCTATPNAPGCEVQVQVSYNFSFIVPLVHNGSITLSSTSEMVIAH